MKNLDHLRSDINDLVINFLVTNAEPGGGKYELELR